MSEDAMQQMIFFHDAIVEDVIPFYKNPLPDYVKILAEEFIVNRTQNREHAVIAVYQNLVLSRPEEELLQDNFSPEEIAADPYMVQVVRQALGNTDRYHGYIDRVLEDWSFARLGYLEQSILLCGCAEFDLQQVEAPVIVNEYVNLAKKFCEPDSYKLINGVLDRI